MTVREIKPAFLDHVKDQMQIDCDGLNFHGNGRHAEFLIAPRMIIDSNR
jgi:hypothetical protein